MEMRVALIEEDIRKKENTVIGYKQAFQGSEELTEELIDAILARTRNAKRKDKEAIMTSAVKGFMEIKNQAIDRKSQQPPQTK
jgi:hypothetical protein